MVTKQLSDFERKILREAVGLEPPSRWGAAVGAVLEMLRGSGYLANGQLTERGRAELLQEVSDGH